MICNRHINHLNWLVLQKRVAPKSWRTCEHPVDVGHKVDLDFFFFAFQHHACSIWKFPGSRGRIGAGKCPPTPQPQDARSKLCLRPPPRFLASLDPQPTEQAQGLNPHSHGYQLNLFPLHHNGNSYIWILKGNLDISLPIFYTQRERPREFNIMAELGWNQYILMAGLVRFW